MATVVNQPASDSGSNGLGFVLGIILLIAFAFLLLFYGLPLLQGRGTSGPSLSVPNKLDVNVQQPK